MLSFPQRNNQTDTQIGHSNYTKIRNRNIFQIYYDQTTEESHERQTI